MVAPVMAPHNRRSAVWAAGLALLVGVAAWVFVPEPTQARAAAIAGVCLVLWLTEAVPPFVPTLVLLVATPLLLGGEFGLAAVLRWSADPVLALFFGGFALSVAAHRHGVDVLVTRRIVSLSRHRRRTLLALVVGGTAFLSMWLSNIAAAALMVTALRPVIQGAAQAEGDVSGARFRVALLLGIAMGGNLGGITTPIGSGPNAIAIAAIEGSTPITFVSWMGFALPLVIGMLLLAYAILVVRYRVNGTFEHTPVATAPLSSGARGTMGVFIIAVLAWLTEPLHGVSAPLVALAVTAVLFGVGLLQKSDLGAIDWSTLGLVAGGICLGKLIEHSGLFEQLATLVDWAAYPRLVILGALLLIAALLSALMSNTGAAALLIPLALTLVPTPSTAVLIAVATSFGVMFVISTPPNAMAYGEGGVTGRDVFVVGLPIMVVGCALVTLTGGLVLGLIGIP